MKRTFGLLALVLLIPACASDTPAPPSASMRSVSVREEMKTFWEEQDALERGEVEETDEIALRRRWMARFREFTRCGDPVEEDRAYGAWALLLANLENAGLEGGMGREALPLFREWAERYPASKELGESLWMLTDTATDEENGDVLGFLGALSGSPADDVARGALAARADLLEYLDRNAEAPPLLEEVVRRWPDSFEARIARRDLHGMSLTAGAGAPAFALRDLQGHEVSLASLRGRVALLVFFSFG